MCINDVFKKKQVQLVRVSFKRMRKLFILMFIMNKKYILKNLQLAKPDHIEWIKQGHQLLKGVPQNTLKKPVQCTECGFGKWYYDEGYKLVNIPLLKDIEVLHQEIHKTYTVLYYVTFDRRIKPRATLISGGIEVPVNEKAFRQKKLKLLEKKTVSLVRALGDVEKKVHAMKDKDFESGWFV
ncbi:MAG TPA: hypothetical protein EYH38_02060 [Leucothrix sp.]|nr:hypothetical protein [Leucothrix sp.]